MRSLLLALALVLSCGVATIGQRGATAKPDSSPPRLPDGQYDLEGVWDFSTITPLERPNSLANKQTLTDEEALTFEREENQRQNRDLIDPKKGGLSISPAASSRTTSSGTSAGARSSATSAPRSSSIRRTAGCLRSRRKRRRGSMRRRRSPVTSNLASFAPTPTSIDRWPIAASSGSTRDHR